ncbi:conserved hypothetical protein [Talaromyces stipitatus ATCC 10500]|uniref:MGS207 protein n=1 Tax=Talaromyces stipitatus (strain ATCC 10500 / CBS 375.48 / QM 6759 / NRRL 1006) TaxID=441959 RepID=B8MTH5_TALSN|nr:uncharacterized protein TSTA_003650 [Talaromyces stipitatus ATCC 10500]EED12307.1 conserved hypothetical protein [Talaromyces stipitatus ATCC 10500]
MASLLSKILAFSSSNSIRVPTIKSHDIENPVEKPAKTLYHLVRLNHINHSVWIRGDTPDNSTTSHNFLPQHLVSAFLFGADNYALDNLYEANSGLLEPWKDAPGEVVGSDWMDFLGKREYERAFLDLFEDSLVEEGYDWKVVLQKYLFSAKQPLISSITAGLGRPLIHLALALQMSIKDIAMEALTLVATAYYDNDILKYSDDPSYFQAEPIYKTPSVPEILGKVRTDERFTNEALITPGEHNMAIIFRDHEAALLDHCNAWMFPSDLTTHFRDSQKAIVSLFLGTSNSENKYDKCLLYPLLMSHAIQVLFPHIPGKVHISLVQQWWLTTLAIYVAQLRPDIDFDLIEGYDMEGKDWNWIRQQALKGPHAMDAYFVSTLRVLRELGEAWEDLEGYYLKAAVKFVDVFDGWQS